MFAKTLHQILAIVPRYIKYVPFFGAKTNTNRLRLYDPIEGVCQREKSRLHKPFIRSYGRFLE